MLTAYFIAAGQGGPGPLVQSRANDFELVEQLSWTTRQDNLRQGHHILLKAVGSIILYIEIKYTVQ